MFGRKTVVFPGFQIQPNSTNGHVLNTWRLKKGQAARACVDRVLHRGAMFLFCGFEDSENRPRGGVMLLGVNLQQNQQQIFSENYFPSFGWIKIKKFGWLSLPCQRNV